MGSRTDGRRDVCRILPPHIVRSIAERGSAAQRERALHVLAIDSTLRAMRSAAPARVPFLLAAPEAEKRRTIYTAKHTETLPGTVVRGEGDALSGDAAVDEAYDGLGATWDLYWEAYARNSIDDEGLPLDATVHYGRAYDNAFWDGKQMVFGDGDDDLFRRFTVAIDIIGHELTHGVTEHEAGLQYFLQPGALNESVSDVFGSLVKQWSLKQSADQADWLIGAGLFTKKVKGVALRSMKAPGTAYDDPVLGKDPQPDHWSRYVRTMEDNGGVHINSGIPNKAFYLAAVGIGGYAWEKAGRIWYETLRDSQLRASSGFKTFARRTLANTQRLFGPNSGEEQVVREAWAGVGIEV
jgi:Zn-dependent metalloprotease